MITIRTTSKEFRRY
nr:unnamed protein product [Callosobruchus analis]